ncbi:MAG: hypothetical protein IJA72_03260 [Clostridia bacterium]|nr:hypothetical protein [Clostridia bacterium]
MKIIVSETITKYHEFEIDDAYEQNIESMEKSITENKRLYNNAVDLMVDVLYDYGIHTYKIKKNCEQPIMEDCSIEDIY